MAEPRIADDYSFIAQRLREIEAENMPTPVPTPVARRYSCDVCVDMGWIATRQTTSGWIRCVSCDQSYNLSRPPGKDTIT